MRDLRAQHGVGANAVDQLDRFFELKVYAGAEPDVIRLEETQIRRAMSTPDFFLVVVSHVEGEHARPNVRVIAEPVRQLHLTENKLGQLQRCSYVAEPRLRARSRRTILGYLPVRA